MKSTEESVFSQPCNTVEEHHVAVYAGRDNQTIRGKRGGGRWPSSQRENTGRDQLLYQSERGAESIPE